MKGMKEMKTNLYEDFLAVYQKEDGEELWACFLQFVAKTTI